MLIASWNVNSLNVRLEHVLQWLKEKKPDVLALQETKLPDEKFPAKDIERAGYNVCFSGQKTYNGVAIVSKWPILEPLKDIPGLSDPQRRLVATTVNGVRIINVYIPNGQEVGSEKYAYKFVWLKAFQAFLENQLKQCKKLVVLGDFNIAPEDIDVHDPKRWQGKIMCSKAERGEFRKMLNNGLIDAVRTLHPDRQMYTWWDYRLAAYGRGWGLRIDHILATTSLTPVQAGVDRHMREKERPSDHAPVWVVFN